MREFLAYTTKLQNSNYNHIVLIKEIVDDRLVSISDEDYAFIMPDHKQIRVDDQEKWLFNDDEKAMIPEIEFCKYDNGLLILKYDETEAKGDIYAQTKFLDNCSLLPTNKFLRIIQIEKSIDDIMRSKSNRIVDIPSFSNSINSNIILEIDGVYYGPIKIRPFYSKDGKVLIDLSKEYQIKKIASDKVSAKIVKTKVDRTADERIGFFWKEEDCFTDEASLIRFYDVEKEKEKIDKMLDKIATLGKIDFSKLQAAFTQINQEEYSTDELNSIKSVFEKGQLNYAQFSGIAQSFFNELDDAKKDLINKFFEDNPTVIEGEKKKYLLESDKAIAEQNEKFFKLLNDIASKEKLLDELNIHKKNIEDELEQIKVNKQKLLEEQASLNNEKINQQKACIDELKSAITDLDKQKEEKQEDIEAKNARLVELQKDLRRYKTDLNGFIDQIIKEKISDDVRDLLINKIEFKNSNNDMEDDAYNTTNDVENFISLFVDNIRSARPAYSSDFIKNILICISQNFATIFAGPPGSGKTSICNLLANEFGVYDKDRFSIVEVEKGWTTPRDLIGYFNPFTNAVESKNPKFFKQLQISNEECEKQVTDAPVNLVVLDEANLSPIEYYWSSFSSIYDDVCNGNVERQVHINNQNKFKIAKTLRFLGTINYDYTTEMLSERFLDRVWIIRLDNNLSIDNINSSSIKNANQIPINFYDIIEYMTPNTTDCLDEDLEVKLGKIIAHLKDMKVNVSYRALEKIKKYLIIAVNKGIIEEKDLALDYAILQKLIILINGYGEEYGEKINLLKDLCNDFSLKNTVLELDKIIENGKKNNDNYSYFGV